MTGALAVVAALLVAQVDAGRAAGARRELAAVAARIEEMKAAGVRGGPEIERLLARSQALSAELERLERPAQGPGAGAASAAADPQELRERADALRDEVDRLTSTLSALDARLRDEGRRRRAGRLAAMEEEGALFAEASPGRVGATRAGATGASGPAGPAGPTGPTGGDAAAPPPGPATGGPTAPFTPPPTTPPPTTPPTGAGPAAAPPGPIAAGALWPPQADSRAWSERLAPAQQDGEPELRRKREAVAGAIAEARRRIERIEAEARELDARP